MSTPALPPIPVTLLTGFLGAGKTTLLRHLLAHVDARRICVVENELGAANIDSEIIETLAPGLVRRVNGCICCAVKTDLVGTFTALAEVCRAQSVERVLLETTGMAEPAEIVPVFRPGSPVAVHFRLSAVVTVTDAEHIAVDLVNSPVAQGQVAVADLVLLNKVDRVDEGRRARVREALERANPLAKVRETVRGECPPEEVLADAPAGPELGPEGPSESPAQAHVHAHRPHHHGEVGAVLVRAAGPHDLRRLGAALRRLTRERRDDLLRCKGFVHASRGRRVLLQGVREYFTFEPFGGFAAGAAETRLIFIGLDLEVNALEAALAECELSTRSRHNVKRG